MRVRSFSIWTSWSIHAITAIRGVSTWTGWSARAFRVVSGAHTFSIDWAGCQWGVLNQSEGLLLIDDCWVNTVAWEKGLVARGARWETQMRCWEIKISSVAHIAVSLGGTQCASCGREKEDISCQTEDRNKGEDECFDHIFLKLILSRR